MSFETVPQCHVCHLCLVSLQGSAHAHVQSTSRFKVHCRVLFCATVVYPLTFSLWSVSTLIGALFSPLLLECVSSQQKLEVQCFVKADEIVSSSSAAETDVRASSSGMSAETVSTKRRPSPSPNNAGDCGPSPKRLSSQTHDPGNGLSTSLNVSFGQLPSPRITRRSWRRSSLKQGTNRRKSLPPLYADVTGMSSA